MTRSLTVYVVLDSQNTIVGTFRKEKDAQEAADSHAYFCRIIPQNVK